MKSGSKDLVRFGLVGCGAWGRHHAAAIAKTPGAALTAIVDASEKNRADARAAHAAARVYADYGEMLAREQLEVVAIALPSHLHYAAAKASLEAGCHLFLEKPMCLRLDHCDDLIALAQHQGLHLSIAQQFRFSPLWGRIKQLIEEGAIGDLRYCLIELWRNPFRLGENGWRYDIERVGSWILEEAIHFFDLARWYFAQAGKPVSVFASAGHQRDEHPELQDHFTATLHFPNGGYAVITQTLAGYQHHQTAKLAGTRGALWANWSGALDRTPHPAFSLKHFNGREIRDVPVMKIPGEVYDLEEQLVDFTSSVRGTPSCGASGKDGRRAVDMCLKAQESVRTGKLIRFPV